MYSGGTERPTKQLSRAGFEIPQKYFPSGGGSGIPGSSLYLAKFYIVFDGNSCLANKTDAVALLITV